MSQNQNENNAHSQTRDIWLVALKEAPILFPSLLKSAEGKTALDEDGASSPPRFYSYLLTEEHVPALPSSLRRISFLTGLPVFARRQTACPGWVGGGAAPCCGRVAPRLSLKASAARPTCGVLYRRKCAPRPANSPGASPAPAPSEREARSTGAQFVCAVLVYSACLPSMRSH